MLSGIFRMLEEMHRKNGWDDSAADAFGRIAEWLEQHNV